MTVTPGAHDVHLPEPGVEPVTAWCGRGSQVTVLLHNPREYLRQNVTCSDCKALDERTRYGLPSTGRDVIDEIVRALRDTVDRAATLPFDTPPGKMLAEVADRLTVNTRASAVRTAADGVSPPTGGPTDLYGIKPRATVVSGGLAGGSLASMRSAVEQGPDCYGTEGWHALCARLLAALDVGQVSTSTEYEWCVVWPEHGIVGIGATEDRRAAEQDFEGWRDQSRYVGTLMRRPVGDWDPDPEQPS